MKWFNGSINEAVATSKSRKAIFVVFIEGKDDTSVQVAQAINDAEVSRRLEQEEFVAIRLESGSQAYRFFVQIYQLVPVPSIFFIGENGRPVEIIAGNATAADLASKIDIVLSKVGKDKSASINLIQSEQMAIAVNSATSSKDEVNVDKNDNKLKKPDEVVNTTMQSQSKSVIANNLDDGQSTSLKVFEAPAIANEPKETTVKELTAEEKIARAQELIEAQRLQRLEEEKRKEKERELERRKIGRDVQKLRQKQQDLEMKQAYEERMKEKAADAAAREKVLQQIAQDKLERKQKELAIQQPEPSTTTFKLSTSNATVSKIQFRLPSGNPYIGQFDPTTTLRDLRTYVVENINLPFRQFAMSTSFPRRELTCDEDHKTLLELELVPTAVILILPLTTPNISTTVTSTQDVGFISRFVWSTFAIFTAVYNYVVGYFTASTDRDPPKQPNTSTESKKTENNTEKVITSSVEDTATTSGLGRRFTGNRATTSIKTDGNIHRLHSSADENDENNTWNGNSTQQM